MNFEIDPKCIFFTLITQLLLVTFCYTPAGIEVSFQMDEGGGRRRMERQTDMEVEIVN